MSRIAPALMLIISFLNTASAQAPPAVDARPVVHQHSVLTTNVIDGAVHPELITESRAYRIYFFAMSVAQSPSAAEQKRQHTHLMKSGIEENDCRILIGVLADFRTKYDALIANYNASATAALARNEPTDIRTLLRGFDALVQSTRDTINVRLTPKGAAQLHSFVMSEKKNMRVQAEDQ